MVLVKYKIHLVSVMMDGGKRESRFIKIPEGKARISQDQLNKAFGIIPSPSGKVRGIEQSHGQCINFGGRVFPRIEY